MLRSWKGFLSWRGKIVQLRWPVGIKVQFERRLLLYGGLVASRCQHLNKRFRDNVAGMHKRLQDDGSVPFDRHDVGRVFCDIVCYEFDIQRFKNIAIGSEWVLSLFGRPGKSGNGKDERNPFDAEQATSVHDMESRIAKTKTYRNRSGKLPSLRTCSFLPSTLLSFEIFSESTTVPTLELSVIVSFDFEFILLPSPGFTLSTWMSKCLRDAVG